MTQVLGIVDIVWRGRQLSVEKGTKLRLVEPEGLETAATINLKKEAR